MSMAPLICRAGASKLSVPGAGAVHQAPLTSSSLVTSAGMKAACPPSSLATSSPALEGRSTITTEPPLFTKRVAAALPSPEAPPVISATRPARAMASDKEWKLSSRLQAPHAHQTACLTTHRKLHVMSECLHLPNAGQLACCVALLRDTAGSVAYNMSTCGARSILSIFCGSNSTQRAY